MSFYVEIQVVSLEVGIVFAFGVLLVEGGAGIDGHFVHLHNLRLQHCGTEKATE